MNPILVVPARLGATRLPCKPLLDIGGSPMIAHVWRRACEAGIGRVIVATDSVEIAEVIIALGGEAVITSDRHISGSDRSFEAVQRIDPDQHYDVIVNVQGDLPFIRPMDIQSCVTLMEDSNVSIGTTVAEIHPGEDKTAASIVKMIGTQFAPGRFRALYFTRALCPWGEGPHYQHIGIYAWRRTVLGQFVNLPPSTLETREKLEQLRALEAGMRIDAALVPEVPLSVDTPADLEHARTTMRS